jgi:hypothetical protein
MLRRWSRRHNVAPGERRVDGDVLEQQAFVGACRDHAADRAPVDFRDDHAVLRDDLVVVLQHGTGLRADDGDPAVAGGHDVSGERAKRCPLRGGAGFGP